MSSSPQTSATSSSPQVIDVDSLLNPISEETPGGESLQYSGVYDEIREARRSDEELDQGDWKKDNKTADWPLVLELSADALSTKTKDLQICAWLTEAAVKRYGFNGLRDCLTVFTGLHEKFWDGLFPEIDEGDMEARGNAISWMDRQAALGIREIPLTVSSSGYSYSLIDFDVANSFNVGADVDPSVAEERRQRAAAEGKITTDDWQRAKQAGKRAFYEKLNTEIEECWANFQILDRAIDERFGNQTPGMGALKKALEELRNLIGRIVKEKRLLEPDPSDVIAAEDGTGAGGEAGAGGATGVAGTTGPIRTRADAVNRLKDVANYFRQTEPHSPVSFLVERAVKWAQMPLDSWLASVIKDANVLDSLRETLGIDGSSSE